MTIVWAYLAYLLLSVGLTVWVGWTLYKNGRVFLIDALTGNEKLADSLNHLLLVGFYLVNVGFVSLYLKYGPTITDAKGALEYVSTKIGIVLLVLGAMHFFNLFVLSCVRRHGMRNLPPVEVLPARRTYNEDTESDAGLRTRAVPVEDGWSRERR
jgi:hypothetical protein